MDRDGIEAVDTIAFDGVPDSILEQLNAAQIRTHILPSRRRRPIAYMHSLHRLVRQNKYDVVHINGNSGTVAIDLISCLGTGARARIVHSRNTQGRYGTLDKLLSPVMQNLCTDRVACGRDAGHWLFGTRTFTVIPNGRDFGEYSYNSETRRLVRCELGLSEENVAVGHVGNFNEAKNHKFLIETFALALGRNPDLRLFLVGDGALRTDAEAQARALGIEQEVVFLGRSARVPEFINALDIALLPSLYEGFPNVVIEWQISGLPSLVSTAVTDECAVTGLVEAIPAGDLYAWAERIACAVPVDRTSASRDAQQLLQAAGYEAREGAARLRVLYSAIALREELAASPS
ncbi:glycosyltransferase [Nesterenkonia sp. YGD6]|uniref:glycosyltransferase n=1 Tax=Nesterenkonia sp. YGD6 TaxID=2901231 RepID=UPI001F4CC6CC|nr:glycosyltransferase [Nesterenkonia sp. YGD6]MCH8563288.1 glycosyltransferase [Nesterenkonia sp. YGD6]